MHAADVEATAVAEVTAADAGETGDAAATGAAVPGERAGRVLVVPVKAEGAGTAVPGVVKDVADADQFSPARSRDFVFKIPRRVTHAARDRLILDARTPHGRHSLVLQATQDHDRFVDGGSNVAVLLERDAHAVDA